MTSKQKTKRIPLTQNQSVIVDAEDYERLKRYKWYAGKSCHRYRVLRTIRCNGRRTTLFMHREIMHAVKGVEINHINCNGLDNRKANLRICTNQQAQFARIPMRDKTSVFKGIHWRKQRKKWVATIERDYRYYFLGYFDDEIEAAKAYDAKAIELFGEFAYLNFPKERVA